MKIEKAVKLAIANVLKEGLTDIFQEPFECSLLKNIEFQKAIKKEVIKAISGNTLETMRIFPVEHVLLPKTVAFDFRRCALMQPLDTIKYLTLVILFAEEIERHRPSKARKIIFSYRYSPNKGYLFDPSYTYTSFIKYINDKSKRSGVKILISCDIANFYDRINLHRLESILHSLSLEKNQIRLLNQLLFFWSNRDSYGLPVGSNASRILAEASLLEVDEYLLSIGVDFCRFVDDYKLFAPDITTAHYWLTQLIERLWFEGITINKSKTKIEDVSDLSEDNINKFNKTKTEIKESIYRMKGKDSGFKQPFRIIAGYGGTIPTKFREANVGEKEKLSEINAKTLLKEIKSSKLVDPEDVKEFLGAALYGRKFPLFAEIPSLLDKFPQCTPYAADLLIKNKDKIPEKIRMSIRDDFATKLNKKKYLPEYIAIALIRILGTDGFQDGTTLFNYFRALRRNAGAYIGRALLDALESVVSRGQVLEIRRYFARADSWEKRQIVRIVDKYLHEDEKRPWLKNIKIQELEDLFLIESITPSKIKPFRKKNT